MKMASEGGNPHKEGREEELQTIVPCAVVTETSDTLPHPPRKDGQIVTAVLRRQCFSEPYAVREGSGR